jgi:hypothetical protein
LANSSRASPRSHQLDELVVERVDELWLGSTPAILRAPTHARADLLGEVLDYLEVDVGLEQRRRTCSRPSSMFWSVSSFCRAGRRRTSRVAR